MSISIDTIGRAVSQGQMIEIEDDVEASDSLLPQVVDHHPG
jgi:hypothetical protein